MGKTFKLLLATVLSRGASQVVEFMSTYFYYIMCELCKLLVLHARNFTGYTSLYAQCFLMPIILQIMPA